MWRCLVATLLAFCLVLVLARQAFAPIYIPPVLPEPEIEQELQEPEPEPLTEIYIATAYTWTGNRTATGTWPQEGRTIAVDPLVIPLGSEVCINGAGPYIAEDTGGAIRGKRIDIYMDTREKAEYWGVQEAKVRVDNGANEVD